MRGVEKVEERGKKERGMGIGEREQSFELAS